MTRVPQEHNIRAYFLARLGSRTNEEIGALNQLIQTLIEPSITPHVKVLQVQVAWVLAWAEEVVRYLKEGKLPEARKQFQQVWMCLAQYILIEDTLTDEDTPYPSSRVSPSSKQSMSYVKYTKGYVAAMREIGCWPSKP
jgi:hypothetical protein